LNFLTPKKSPATLILVREIALDFGALGLLSISCAAQGRGTFNRGLDHKGQLAVDLDRGNDQADTHVEWKLERDRDADLTDRVKDTLGCRCGVLGRALEYGEVGLDLEIGQPNTVTEEDAPV
jgi:hypothetical protein